MRTILLALLSAAFVTTGCGKGNQPKPLGAVGNNDANNASQISPATAPGAGATGPGSIGEGGGGNGPQRTSANPGGGTPAGSD